MNYLLPDNSDSIKIGLDAFETKYPLLFKAKTKDGILYIVIKGKKINIGTFLENGTFYLSKNISLENLAKIENILEEKSGLKVSDDTSENINKIINKKDD